MISVWHRAPHLVRVFIQKSVLHGSEGDPTGDERGSPGRSLVAAEVSDQPCALLTQLLPRLSPAEGHRPHAFSPRQEDAGAA